MDTFHFGEDCINEGTRSGRDTNMDCDQILQGIIIGGSGGAIAGITLGLIRYLHVKCIECYQRHRVYNWLLKELKKKKKWKFISTRTIASFNNLTMDRTRYICSLQKEIFLSVGPEEDKWGIYGISGREKELYKRIKLCSQISAPANSKNSATT